MRLLLAIDLHKAGKKGARWKKHAYLARIMRPDGVWDYIYPDKKLDGYFLDNGQFQLNQGVSLAGIINRELFGGPTGAVDKKTGRPVVRDGKFRTYAVVSDAQREKDRMAAREQIREAKRRGAQPPAMPYENAIGYETVGQYRVYEYSKVPVVGEENGKPLYGGFLSVEFHPSVTGKYGYKVPAKLLQHLITKPEHIAVAQDVTMGGAIATGKTATKPQHPAQGNTPEPGEVSIHAAPEQSEETLAVLGLTMEDTADPLAMAKKMFKRLLKKKKQAEELAGGSTVKLKPFPDWVLDKYSEQELLDGLQRKPLTTMLSLGLFKPTGWTRKLNDALHAEWAGTILSLARRDFDAYKHTEAHEHFRRQDEEDGGHRVRKYRNDVVHDLMQHGVETLLRLAQAYQPTRDTADRFDKYAYRVVERTLARESAKQAIHDKTFVPIVHEGDIETAARQQGGKEPLAPQEMVELSRSTPVARAAFHRIFHNPTMPETYKRILAARLWLEDGDTAAEDKAREERSATAERAIDAAIENKRDIKVPSTSGKWLREFTGRADSLAEVYPVWTDPKSGETVDLSTVSKKTQFRRLSHWWDMARAYLLRELSVPLKRVKPPKGTPGTAKERYIVDEEWRHSIVDVPVDPDAMSAAEKLFSAATGEAATEARVLTAEGKAVKRYLELETKLARENRRRWTEAVHADVEPAPYVAPKPGSRQLSRVMLVPHKPIIGPRAISLPKKEQPHVHPAIKFFTESPNQNLARRLGLQLERLERDPTGGGATGGGVFATPHVSIGMVAQRELTAAEQHHTTLQRLQTVPQKDFDKEYSKHRGQLQALQDLGQWQQTKGTIHWHQGTDGVSALHHAAVAYHHARQTILDKHEARAQKRHFFSGQGYTEAEIKEKLKPFASTKAERQTLKDAVAEYQRLAGKVSAAAPQLAAVYEQALKAREPIHDHLAQGAKAALTKLQRDTGHHIALMQFESDRRVALKTVKKGVVPIADLADALLAYDFELGRLASEIAA